MNTVEQKFHEKFAKNVRYQGGEYLIESNGKVLRASNPMDLKKKYQLSELDALNLPTIKVKLPKRLK
jgi:hypothetical protein